MNLVDENRAIVSIGEADDDDNVELEQPSSGKSRDEEGDDDDVNVSSESHTNDDSNRTLTKAFLEETGFLVLDLAASTVVGFLVVSYWRGSWVLLDIWTCNQPGSAGMLNGESFCFSGLLTDESYREVHLSSAWQSYVAANVLLAIGLALVGKGWWQPAASERNKVTLFRATLRFMIVYILGAAAVGIWHGIWYFIDYGLLPNDPLASYWTSTVVGATLCYSLLAGASMLAPPAIFLMDGPSRLPPPIAVTLLQSYRSISQPANEMKKEKDPLWVVLLDMFVSFLVLPWGVVGFWRGAWLLFDWYLWGVTDQQQDLHLSMLYSLLISLACLVAASEDVVQHFPTNSLTYPRLVKWANRVFGRTRTLVLAIGAVNFWRCVWYVWDEFLGETQTWSAALSHVIGVLGLLALGCVSCINAPASTLGVDCIADPDAADEPLFHNVPVPYEVLYVFSIGRQPLGGPQPPPPPLERGISTRFLQQTAGQLDRLGRGESASSQLLNRRHMLKRQKSQFFRSR